MNLGQSKHIVFSLAIDSLLLFGLFLPLMLNVPSSTVYAWPVTPMPSPQPPGTRPPGPAFVKPGGTGGGVCRMTPVAPSSTPLTSASRATVIPSTWPGVPTPAPAAR